jgi:hypothetical protein
MPFMKNITADYKKSKSGLLLQAGFANQMDMQYNRFGR